MKIEILDSNSASQPYFWRIIATNGRELAKSETLHSKSNAVSAAQTLKSSATALRFEVFRSNNGVQPWSWRVWANNNKILVSASETYYNQADAQSAADSVKWNASKAEIVDKTRSASASRW